MEWCAAHARLDHADLYRKRLRQVAYVARYANIPPSESRHYDSRWLNDLCTEVDRLIREENEPRDHG